MLLPESLQRVKIMFNRNVGKTDKAIRLIAGAILIGLGLFYLGLSGVAGIIATAIGAILALTGIINFCPIFRLLGINTFKTPN